MFDLSAADSPVRAAEPVSVVAAPHSDSGAPCVGYHGAEVRDAVDVLGAGLAALVAVLDPDAVVARDAPGLWAGFAQIERMASAGMTLLARRVEESTCWKDAGMRSAVEYLAQRSGTTRQAAGETLATSKQLPELGHVNTALRKGGLSPVQAYLVADAASADPVAQRPLLDAARTSSVKELRDECARVKAAADPDPDATRRRQQAGRRLRQFSDAEGAWHAHAQGNPDVAGVFNAALTPIIDELFHEARTEGRREPRDALAFDALIEMARRAYATTYSTDDETSGGEEEGSGGADTSGVEDSAGPIRREDPDDPNTSCSGKTADSRRGDERSRSTNDSPAVPDDLDTGAVSTNPSPDPEVMNRAQHREHQRNARKRHNKRPNLMQLPVLRLDLEALRRGRLDGAEICEIVGLGPISIQGARELLDESVVKLVITADGDVVSVAHLGKGPEAARRVGVRRSPLPETCSHPTHLTLLHVDIDDIQRRALPGDEVCNVPGAGVVSVPAAHELLGSAVLDIARRRSVPIAQIVHRGRKPTVAQRTALRWTQPNCSVAGCPHSFTQIDHREDWAKTHYTRLDLLDRLCPHHHRLKTHHGWALVPGTGKRPFVPPDDPRHPGRGTTPQSGNADNRPIPASAA